ncbi:MAG: response regulator [Gemmatimonadetes bacterium]|nr:response regulator [Gemmatimonadota bacterium]
MASWDEIVRTAKILLVDDDAVMITLCTTMLKKAGYQHVWSTRKPTEARQLFREIRPDLVLLDMNMVPMNGMEVMQQLQGETPEGEYVPIVMITADVSRELRLEALGKGAKDFMTKPVEWGEAMLRIRTRLESRFRFLEMQRTIEQLRRSPGGEGAGAAGDATSAGSNNQGGMNPQLARSTVAALLNSLDSIAELIDLERFAEARERLRGRRWLADTDVRHVPPQIVTRVQQWIDTGHEALCGSDLDIGLARNTLLQARRVITA